LTVAVVCAQFDSAADQLRRFGEFKGIDKAAVRARTVAWLRAHRDYRLGDDDKAETLEEWIGITQGLTWDAYCAKMAKDKEWGDEVTMKAITEEFGVRIFLWSSTVSESNYFSEHVPRAIKAGAAPDRSLLMCHVLEVHYCSLRLKAPAEMVAASASAVAPPSVPADAQLRLLQALFTNAAPTPISGAPPPDEHAPDAAHKSVVIDGSGDAWSVELLRGTRRASHFYVLQVLRDGASGGFVCHARWGIAPHAGQCKTDRFAAQADAEAAFERKFAQKTGVEWRARKTTLPPANADGRLYVWVTAEQSAPADEAQRALTASLIARVAADASQPALAIGKLVDLSSGRATVLPTPAAAAATAAPPSVPDEAVAAATSSDDDFVLVGGAERTEHTLSLRRGWTQQHTLVACFFEYAKTAPAGAGDWIGLYDVGADTRSYLRYWKTNGATDGFVSDLLSRKHFGALELRLIRGADWCELARSEPFTHGPRLRLRAACEGNRIVVSWQDVWQVDVGADEAECVATQRSLWRTTSDWLGLYLVREDLAAADDDGDDGGDVVNDSSNSSYIAAEYINGDACTFNRSALKRGVYEIRFFSSHRKYHCLSRTRLRIE
jgi:predicted DNA-binding WGR domain protein